MQRLAHAVRFEHHPASQTLRTRHLDNVGVMNSPQYLNCAGARREHTTILPLLTMRFTQETKEDFLAGALPVHEGAGHSVSDDEETRVQQRECKC
jgi:hypothetical protein